jgi:RNA polymerase sigma-70 factor (family 1)
MQGSPNVENDKELLELLARDSEYAFAVLFDKYRKPVYNSALLFLKDTTAAEEIVQEVFLRVWQKRKDLGEISYINSFIKTIAYNLMVDQFRKAMLEKDYKKQLAREISLVDDTDHRVRSDESVRLLQAAIATLPPRQKQVYELARIKGLSQEEIAVLLSISRNTVKVHMTAALQSIRSYLAVHYPDTLGSIPILLLMARMTGK